MNKPLEVEVGHASAPWAVAALPVVSLAVAGSPQRFPVGRIFCVGRNYADHAREMGHNPDREPPFFFMKPATALVADGGDFPYPPLSKDVHHEVELVVALRDGGRDIAAGDALSHVFGYAVGLDMTRRDLQAEAKKQGPPVGHREGVRPWRPLLGHRSRREDRPPARGAITLHVNGQLRQQGDLAELIWSVPETIACLSGLFTLLPGDLIYTGTPAGVGPVQRGDVVTAAIHGVGELNTRVV